jgi:hypothetical protein
VNVRDHLREEPASRSPHKPVYSTARTDLDAVNALPRINFADPKNFVFKNALSRPESPRHESLASRLGFVSILCPLSNKCRNHSNIRRPRRPCHRVSNALGYAGPRKRKCTNCGSLCFGMHNSAWLYSAWKNLRRFKGLARIPFGHPRLCHARFVESLSIGHPLVDCTARRFNPSNYLATSARYLRIFS